MAAEQKGSRRIVVDGAAYRWRIRRRLTYSAGNAWSGLQVSVQPEVEPICTLLLEFNARPDNWIDAPASIAAPRLVAEGIRAALAAGWTPLQPGSAFCFDMRSRIEAEQGG